jgi:hypothetical protein
MGIAENSIAAAAAAFSGFAAIAAWRASKEANATAAAVAQIERDRWHTELTPQLQLRLTPADAGIDPGLLVRFKGPASLGSLRVRLQVRDDRDRSQDPILAGSEYTAEDRAAVIWGPFRLRPGIDKTDELGRNSGVLLLQPGDELKVAIDPSAIPHWFTRTEGAQQWQRMYEDAPMRLWATCEAEGHRPWRLSFDVPRDGHSVPCGSSECCR